LIIAGYSPLFALTTGPIIGAIVIITFYLVRDVGEFSISTMSFHFRYFLEDIQMWFAAIQNPVGQRRILLIPAIAVHLWLPLFAFGVVFAKAINSFRSSAVWAQWFLKKGREHPLQAIGYVGATLVFIGTGLAQYFL
jgi:hypothetical protein